MSKYKYFKEFKNLNLVEEEYVQLRIKYRLPESMRGRKCPSPVDTAYNTTWAWNGEILSEEAKEIDKEYLKILQDRKIYGCREHAEAAHA